MNSFRQWYIKNSTEITWFVVGVLALSGLQSVGRGDYFNALISFALIGLNLSLNRK